MPAVSLIPWIFLAAIAAVAFGCAYYFNRNLTKQGVTWTLRYKMMAPWPVRITCAITAVALMICMLYFRTSYYGIPGLLCGAFVFGDKYLLQPRRWARLATELKEIQYRRCANCLYDLHGSYPQGRCPECGEPYDWSDLPSRWTSILEQLR
ncbi:MAG: hypothetical protein J5J06_08095 [Phycisphaerae bacterium]|nr:hypothetical protein [Phycisphaerae bacterium]